tara:strand:- start:10188 stop:11105 length:918 start_codon:yes stop_codon:yes gene_type:complete
LKKNNCFITGGSGLLGSSWLFHLKDKYEVFSSENKKKINLDNINFCKIDLLSRFELFNLLNKIKPCILIHTAALSNVEKCELNQDQALKVNVEITKNIIDVCTKLNIKIIYISTDHLFDGTQKYVNENEHKKPLNFYANSKDLAEQLIIKNVEKYLIIRSNFFGWGTSYRKSFSDFIINNLRNNVQVNLFEDVYFTPIIFSELFEKIDMLVKYNKNGIYNIVGNERLSKYEFGLKLSNIFELNNKLINKISIKDMKNLVIRPLDMSLSNKKYITELNDNFYDLEYNINLLKISENEKTTRFIRCL